MKLPNLTAKQDHERRMVFSSVYEDNIRLMEICKSLLCYTSPAAVEGIDAVRQGCIFMCVIGERPPKELAIRRPK